MAKTMAAAADSSDSDEEFVRSVILVGLGCCELLKQDARRPRSCWSRQWLSRREQGAGCVLSMLKNELSVEDKKSFCNYLRTDEKNFYVLLENLEPLIARRDTNMRRCIPTWKKLAVTLRFLATGESFVSLSYQTRIAHNTISVFVMDVLGAIVQTLQKDYVKMPKSDAEWRKVAKEFEERWNFPHCLGSMDGKHIVFRPPRSSGSFYRNYKNKDSIVLLAVVDAQYKFMCVDVGCNGRISDSGVFARSNIKKALDSNSLGIPEPEPLPGITEKVPYMFVADKIFPLRQDIMKPYPHRGLTNSQKIFNYRLSRARRIVENAFGILSNRFGIFLKTINLSAEKVELITLASCILHNFITENNLKYNSSFMPETDTGSESGLDGLSHQGGNRYKGSAQNVRRNLEAYFNGEGAVPWQQKSVDKHKF